MRHKGQRDGRAGISTGATHSTKMSLSPFYPPAQRVNKPAKSTNFSSCQGIELDYSLKGEKMFHAASFNCRFRIIPVPAHILVFNPPGGNSWYSGHRQNP
jgi:hypothetical protein